MAKILAEDEEKGLKNLEKNFDKNIEKYRKEKEQQLKGGKKKELEEELDSLESYLEGVGVCACGNPACMHGCGHSKCKNVGPIATTADSAQFESAKYDVLKKVIRKR